MSSIHGASARSSAKSVSPLPAAVRGSVRSRDRESKGLSAVMAADRARNWPGALVVDADVCPAAASASPESATRVLRVVTPSSAAASPAVLPPSTGASPLFEDTPT